MAGREQGMRVTEKTKKTGIMGGTFDPIHTGHLMLAEWVRDKYQLDEVIFIPTGVSYMKSSRHVMGGDLRLRMVELAIEDREEFSYSDIEIRREGNTYTCETLLSLRLQRPQEQLFFISGADCLFAIENWKDPEVIFQNCTLISAARNSVSMEDMERKRQELAERFHADIRLTTFPNMEISSTDIRERLRQGHSIRYMVPERVRQFILDNQLYLGEDGRR